VELDLDDDFAKIEARLTEAQNKDAKVVPMRSRKIWISIAAAVVLLLAAAPFLWERLAPSEAPMQTFATADSPSEQVILSDGTRVWLNKNTEFSYYSSPNPKVRRVKLKGEAFFDVRENAESPFVVETPDGEVTVLGTTFSVRSVATENDFSVHVASGRVEMTPSATDEKLILTENESGVFQKKEGLLRKEINMALNELAWHTGRISFDGTLLPEALKTLADLYEVEISLENPDLEDCPLNANFHMKGIHSVKVILETMLGAEFVELEQGKYVLRGGKCE
jgi:ferric-dicitrate binding protein FerR (iron transport regulator)